MNGPLEKKEENENRYLSLGIGYVLIVTIIAGYVNYTQPYDNNPVVSPSLGGILLWTLLYVPLVFPLLTKWEVKDLGFSINPFLLLAALLLGSICASLASNITTTWSGAFAEAFARTGEEFFYRGFLFFLLVKIFENKRRSWLWAAVGSAVAFSMIHTQIFQPSYFANHTNPLAYAAIERFLNLFFLAAAFALIRYWTKSVLPTALAHSLSKGGIMTLPFVLIIYAIITYWAYRRKENVFTGLEQIR